MEHYGKIWENSPIMEVLMDNSLANGGFSRGSTQQLRLRLRRGVKNPFKLGKRGGSCSQEQHRTTFTKGDIRKTKGRQFCRQGGSGSYETLLDNKKNQHISSGMCQNPLYIYHRSKNFSILSRNHFFPYTGWWFQPLWKILVNGKDDIPYVMENNPNVPNHQPEMEGASTNEIRILTKIWRLNQRKISFRISNIPFTARKKMSFANQPAASHGNIHVLPARPPWFHH